MFRTLLIVAVLAAVAVPHFLIAQSSPQALTDQQVAAAIELGQQKKAGDIGVEIKVGGFGSFKNVGRDFVHAMAGGVTIGDVWRGFQGRLLTPMATIALAAAENKGTGARFTPTPEMREPIVRIMLKDIGVAPHIKSVVLRKNENDNDGVDGDCISAFPTYPGVQTQGIAMCSGYKFPLAKVSHLLANEFVVTVQVATIQATDIKNFKVERKQLNKLPL